jgi:hypothetical protein
MKIIERLKAPTPKFWQKVQRLGITIGGLGAILIAPPIGLSLVGGYLITAGSVIGVLSQLTIEDGQAND